MANQKDLRMIGSRVSIELAEKFAFHAKAMDLTPSQIMRKMIREWVEEQDKAYAKKKKQEQLSFEG